MKYLIGEIGIVILIAGLIGLIIGWLLSRFLRRGESADNHETMLADIRRRDQEIDRLRYDLRRSQDAPAVSRAGYSDAGSRSDVPRRGGNDDQQVASKGRTLKTDGTSAVLREKPEQKRAGVDSALASSQAQKEARAVTRADTESRVERADKPAGRNEKPARRDAKDDRTAEGAPRRKAETTGQQSADKERAFVTRGQLDSLARADQKSGLGIKDYQSLLEKKNAQVDQLQRNIKDLLALRKKEPHESSAGDGESEERIRTLKLSVEEESYEKLKALAALGEAEQRLAAQDPEVSSRHTGPLQKRAEQQDELIRDLRARIARQQSQNEQAKIEFERKLDREGAARKEIETDLEHYKSRYQSMATQADPKAAEREEQQQAVIVDLRKRLEVVHAQMDVLRKESERKIRETAPDADNDQILALKTSLDEEAFEKSKALAQVGELEQKLRSQRPAVSNDNAELVPLRRRAEQQESIIGDLRKRLQVQQNQSSILRQDYERKLNALRDGESFQVDAITTNTEVARAEIESYQRKLNEVERASQSRIRDFNATLEARNREYDQLGERLERLRRQLEEKDANLQALKQDLDDTNQLKIASEADANRYREQLGEMQIELNTLHARIKALQAERDELARNRVDAGDVEKQLADFTRSTEETAQKFERIIVNQRQKIAEYEARIQELDAEHASRVATYDAQIQSLNLTLEDTQAKQQAALTDVGRLKSLQVKKDTEICSLNKELKEGVSDQHRKQAEVLQLKRSVDELETVRGKLREREAAELDLSKQLETTRLKQTELTRHHNAALEKKSAELADLKKELAQSHSKLESEQNNRARFEQEVARQKDKLLALSKQSDADKQKYASEIKALEPLRQQLADKDKTLARQTQELAASAAKSGDEIKLLHEKIQRLEKANADQSNKSRQEVESLQSQLKEMQALRSEMNKRDSQIVSLNAELKSLRDRDTSQQKELASTRAELQNRKDELGKAQQLALTEQKKLQQEVSRLTPLESRLHDSEKKLASVQESSTMKSKKQRSNRINCALSLSPLAIYRIRNRRRTKRK